MKYKVVDCTESRFQEYICDSPSIQDRIIRKKMEVRGHISDGVVIAIIELGFSKSRKLNSMSILPKECQISGGGLS